MLVRGFRLVRRAAITGGLIWCAIAAGASLSRGHDHGDCMLVEEPPRPEPCAPAGDPYVELLHQRITVLNDNITHGPPRDHADTVRELTELRVERDRLTCAEPPVARLVD